MIQPYEIFLNIFNMSITASWIVFAIIIIRLIFKKAPKAIFVAMWAFVAIRLICPFSVESVLSLIPNTQTVPMEFHSLEGADLHENTVIDIISNPVYQTPVTYELEQSVDRTQLAFVSGYFVWLAGMAAMVVYVLISYLRIHKKVCESIPLQDNIMLCDSIDTPFILGIIKPKIYLPSTINENDIPYVIAHEKAHLKRHDHLWKPLGFLLLTVYWFNPVLWLAYILLCRDIELACDEKVIKELGIDVKKAYSLALINCSTKRRTVTACPLAFGEAGVKKRIKSILSYKKPAFWLIALAVVASIVVGVCFLTDPVEKNSVISNQKSGSTLDGLSAEIISSDFSQPSPYIEIKIKNQTLTPFIGGEEFYIYKQVGGEWVDCRSLDPYVWNTIGYILKSYSTFTHKYSLNYISIDSPGLYRFETTVTKDGDEHKEAEVWIDFEVTEGMQKTNLQLLTAIDMIYDDGMYSYVQTVYNTPSYMLGSNMLLHEMTKDSLITELGVMEETELDNESFDSRFGDNSWFSEYSLKEIRKNNHRMWELYLGNGSERFSELYILLQQKDGSFILGYGYYNCQSENPRNSDDSHIRWLYKMSSDMSLGDIKLNQVATDGTMLFYGEATDEDAYLKQYSSIIQLNNEELNSLLQTFKEQKWIYDGLVDRLSFNFDGQLKYDNKWIYFGYEQRVIYCDEYFCEVSDEIIGSIRTFEPESQTFKPIKANEKIYIYPNSPDLITPNISLNKDNGTFTFTYSGYSSYFAYGKYEYANDLLYLETFDNKYSYVFSVNSENDTLEFLAEKSSPIPEYKYSAYAKETLSPVPDGAVFVPKETDRIKTYNHSVAWADYYSGYDFFAGALNSKKLSINSVRHLPLYKIDTYDDLVNFKGIYKDAFTIDEGWDEVQSFDEATALMDKEFFEENTLFLVYVQANNCTERFGLNSVYNDGENLCIHIEQTNNPEVVETMMAGWFVLVPIEKEDVQTCTSFDADLYKPE